MMLNELSNNLNLLMAKARITSSELARSIGIPATTIKRIRNNEQANPTITTLLPIAQYFSISLNQLIGHESLARETKRSRIPLFSWKECVQHQSISHEKHGQQVTTEKLLGPKAFALMVEENELGPFSKGGILIIDPDQAPDTGDYVIVAKNHEQTISSIRKCIIEIDQIYLKSLVTGVTMTVLTPDYSILGVVVQYKMELK